MVLGRGGFGRIKTRNWILYLTIPNDNCDIYRVCGAYGVCNTKTVPACSCLDNFDPTPGWDGGDFSSGCIRRTPLNCQEGDGFLKYSGVKLPDTEHALANSTLSLQECRVACATNCSCTAYAPLDISNGGTGCLCWFGDLVNMRVIHPGQDIYIRMAKSELGIDIITLFVCVFF